MICPHCAELEEQVAWLKSELGIQQNLQVEIDISTKLHLTPQQTRLIMRLMAMSPKVVTLSQLYDTMQCSDDVDEDNVLKSTISRLRKKLSVLIVNHYGGGYSMPVEEKAHIESLLNG